MSGDRSLVCAEGGAAVNNLDEGLDADVASLSTSRHVLVT